MLFHVFFDTLHFCTNLKAPGIVRGIFSCSEYLIQTYLIRIAQSLWNSRLTKLHTDVQCTIICIVFLFWKCNRLAQVRTWKHKWTFHCCGTAAKSCYIVCSARGSCAMLVTVETVLPFYQLESRLQYGWWIHLWYFYYNFYSQISVYFSDSYEYQFNKRSVICGLVLLIHSPGVFYFLDSFDYFLFPQHCNARLMF